MLSLPLITFPWWTEHPLGPKYSTWNKANVAYTPQNKQWISKQHADNSRQKLKLCCLVKIYIWVIHMYLHQIQKCQSIFCFFPLNYIFRGSWFQYSLPLEGSREDRNTVVWRLKKRRVEILKRSKEIKTAFSRTDNCFYVYKSSKSTWLIHKPKYLILFGLQT